MQILTWLGRGATRVFALFGMIAWLGVTVAATIGAIGQVDAGDAGTDLAQQIALGIGVPLMLIGAPLVLRASGRWGNFFIALACGGLLCVVGTGLLRSMTADMSELLIVLAALAVLVIIAALIPRNLLGAAGLIATLLLFGVVLFGANVLMQSATQIVSEEEQTSIAPAPAATETPGATDVLPSPEATPSTTTPPPPSATPEATEGRRASDVLGQIFGRRRESGPDQTDSGGLQGSAAPPPPAASPSMQSDAGTTLGTRSARGGAPTPSASDFVMEELRFNKPEKMRINQAYVVEAQIGAPMDQQLGTDGEVQHRDVAVPETRLVQVELVANDFDVVKLHTVDEQLVAPGSTGIWSWRVTPRHAGDQALLLQVYGVLRANGQEGRVLVRTYRETIPIEVTAGDQLQMLARSFLQRWDLIAGVFGAIGGIWVFFSNVLKFFRRKEAALA